MVAAHLHAALVELRARLRRDVGGEVSAQEVSLERGQPSGDQVEPMCRELCEKSAFGRNALVRLSVGVYTRVF